MNEQERSDLQALLDERRQEVEKKKEVLERLKQRLGAAEAKATQPRPEEFSAKFYLDQALQVAERARSEVAKNLPPIPSPADEAKRGAASAAAPAKQPEPEMDVKIQEMKAVKIEKNTQTDAEVERIPVTLSSMAAVRPEEDEEIPIRAPSPSLTPTKDGLVAPPANLLPPKAQESLPDLTDDEKKRIMMSQDFTRFIEKTTLTLEKILNQDKIVNLFEDYSGSAAAAADQGQADKLGDILVFEDSKFASRRSVQHLQISPKYGHLFLATYGRRREAGSSEADGTCLVWSLENQTRPHAVFTATSSVTCACFDPLNESLIFGGTAGGSLLLWDIRAGVRPMQKTKVTLTSHKQTSSTHQTYIRNLFVLGTQHNRALLSVDEENRCCTWSGSQVLAHQGTTDLKYKPHEGGAAYKPPPDPKFSTMAVKAKGNRLLGGTQDGSLWDAQYSSSEVQMTNYYLRPLDLDADKWHRGPITNLDMQPSIMGRDDDLVLTSSTDWSVRLWDLSTAGVPMHTFETSTEFIFDVKWAPNHPAVFAMGDGGANLCIWNLNRSWYQPRIQVQVEKEAAISRLEWLMGGRRILAGTSTGKIHCASVGPELAHGRANLTHFDATLDDIRAKIQQLAF